MPSFRRPLGRAGLFLVVAFWLLLLWHSNGKAADVAPPANIAVVASMDIRPYVEAVEAISEALDDAGMEPDVFDLQKYSGKSEDKLAQSLTEDAYGVCIAVGPGAARFARGTGLPFIYTVIWPEDVPGLHDAALCGISLRIPIHTQLATIHGALPDVRSVGLLFDRKYNADFFSEARQIAGVFDLDILPLEVASKKEIPKVLAQSWQKIDALWFILDRTVTSETVIQYINKEAFKNRVPTIGHNAFFYQAGSLLSFVFDYKDLGRQTAALALEGLAEGHCGREAPRYNLLINDRVADRLGIRVQATDITSTGGTP